MNQDRLLFFSLLFALAVFSILTLTWGPIPLHEVLKHAAEKLWMGSSRWNPLLDERLPRLLVLFMTGASLAFSGAVLQSLFQTPLATQDLLGLNSGGSLAVALALLLAPASTYYFSLPLAGAVGTFLALILIYFLSKKNASLYTLLIIGIALSSFLAASETALIYGMRHRWEWITFLTEWRAGSSLDRSWEHVAMQAPLALLGFWGCFKHWRSIDILSFGEKEAALLGIDLKRTRFEIFASLALLNGGALAGLGTLPFFGFLLPIAVRYFSGPESWRLLPFSILSGGVFLLAVDWMLRAGGIFHFSLGHFSALLGSLVFLFALGIRGRSVC